VKPVKGFFSPNFKVRNEPRYLGNPIRTTTRYWVPRLSTVRTFAPMAVISLTSTSWPQSNEEYGIAGNHQSHPVQLLSTHTLFDALPLPLSMPRVARNKELNNPRLAFRSKSWSSSCRVGRLSRYSLRKRQKMSLAIRNANIGHPAG